MIKILIAALFLILGFSAYACIRAAALSDRDFEDLWESEDMDAEYEIMEKESQ